jgi:succinate dehydrogenase flavin-adding protein (antitoxin of CptAB toxin-antitoxin module)
MGLSESALQQLDKLLHLGDNELLDILMERKLCNDATLQQMADSIIAASKGKLNTNT